ncbi:glycoside hydrolase family 32 protein [Allomuricauda sp. SCSIO 65647]|uniref:glycoside hydrolase family 32 protein n=1 Tax=Allomuricauda sp. SCSIO 65647 TaxID=2908843 RepID=UPI001F16AB63|nr:glycoside hydrolase family 32 protein [Muricauda sp. SCSIO 65647]UJH66289.1 glycoside hydrolase family 32 protein [Muricauda sp. SCSIO 65647]
MTRAIFFTAVCLFCWACNDVSVKQAERPVAEKVYQEPFRPQFHFSPPTSWMNDPNGLVYHDGIYHLFYQYYPDATVWGPMHWGHAISENMVHWQNRPIALYPDGQGFIFSGSAVVDENNTSGFAEGGKVPLVAIYTYHSMQGEKGGRKDFQTQAIAYSLDNGETWTKYEGNPVIGNTAIKDFRDPKVFWHDATQSWIMALVAGDHAKFYRSTNLKEWNHISDFGEEQGAHGGVWECPDLFPLKVAGTDETKWVLIISIGSGGPNGGSGTQYFVGDFDGTTFSSDQQEYKWLDWGTDNYAGVTYNNTPGDRIFIGWMSNWQYAVLTPTSTWRSAMTLPRELSLRKFGDDYMLANYPVAAMDELTVPVEKTDMVLEAAATKEIFHADLNQSDISFTTEGRDFRLTLMNDKGENLKVTFDAASHLVIVDRTESGAVDFQQEFGNKLHYMNVRQLPESDYEVRLWVDASSVELFINKGQFVMTQQIFPTKDYTKMLIENTSDSTIELKDFSISSVGSIWQN